MEIVNPANFPQPKGYSNGIVAEGRVLAVAGQVGWDEKQRIVSDDFVAQFRQALENVVAIVRAAGGSAENVVQMTIYVTDLDAYRASLRALRDPWRELMGRHFPAMALVGVAGLVEEGAKVEIQALAVLGEKA